MIIIGGISQTDHYMNDTLTLDLQTLTWRDQNDWIREKSCPFRDGIAYHCIAVAFDEKSTQCMFGARERILQGRS
jgi:hypothetical protein